MPVPTSMKQIADALGVSRATVSNALMGTGRVSAEMAERVQETARRMNYVPSHAGRSLRLGRSTLLGLVVPNFTMPLFADFTQAFERAARARGMALLVGDAMGDADLQAERIQDFVARGVDGLIVVPMRGAELPLESVAVPLAVVDAAANSLNTASSDHRAGGRLIATHLADLGHRAVRIVESARASNVNRERREGMAEMFAARGVSVTVDGVAPDLDSARAYALDWRGPETAIAATYDLLAVGILTGLAARGLRAPDHISVSGFDDVVWGRITTPPLTTVRQDLPAIADHALDVVTGQTRGTRLFPVSLIARGSTAQPDRRDT